MNELIEVTMEKRLKGDKDYQDRLENDIDLMSSPWEEVTNEIPEVIEAKKNKAKSKILYGALSLGNFFDGPDVIYNQDCYLFNFRFFGENRYRDESGAIEWEAYHIGIDEVMDGWQDELIKLGEGLIVEYNQREGWIKQINGTNFIRFITVWNYISFQDSYTNEFDSEWNLLGVLDMSKLTIK